MIDKYRLPASMKTLGAKGSIDWRSEPIHEYRDLWEIDDRVPQLAWLWQLNRGVFKSPGIEVGELDDVDRDERRRRAALRRQLRELRGGDHGVAVPEADPSSRAIRELGSRTSIA